MWFKKSFCNICVMVVVLFFTTNSAAEEFSADMVNTAHGTTFTGKIFVSNNKSRMEMQDVITITRPDKKVVWMLMPSDKTYIEQPFDPRNVLATAAKLPEESAREFLGQEMIDGKKINKYRVIFDIDGTKDTILQWIEEFSNIPVKTASGDGSWSMEYRNLKEKVQPVALFEIPAGYTKVGTDLNDQSQYDAPITPKIPGKVQVDLRQI